jgi:SOS-response transcriptional repressor LexA
MTDRLLQLKNFYKKYKRLPSYSEMLSLFNVSSKNAVFKIVQKWIEEGIVQKIDNKLSPTSRFFALPLMGLVKAGYPASVESTVDFLSLDDYLVDNPQNSFLLRVAGDSLMDIGIFPDDMVLIERNLNAFSGEIVLAQIDREWTLKILRKTKQGIFLESANKKYPPFTAVEELKVMGVVKAVIRKF